MKTNQLTGAALDWAVVKCECDMPAPFKSIPVVLNGTVRVFRGDMGLHSAPISPSTNWAQGGMIIERESIFIVREKAGHMGRRLWAATLGANKAVGIGEESIKLYRDAFVCGPTPLIAAMRCYVASKLGDEVEIPTELTQGEAVCQT
jgi:hypothetical protein